jgi:sulfopyruvate decarboxylase subunit beta
MINRREALQILAGQITDEIVVATYSSASDWFELTDRSLNYFSVGAMGLASSHGLGLALARPERRTIVLDGDGSLLMNLGTLVTIGAVAPSNFTHLVFQNGTYEANGGHPIPNPRVDFEHIARGAGISASGTISDLNEFERAMPTLLAAPGPVFRAVIVEQGPLGHRDYSDMYKAARRDAFRAELQRQSLQN